jgi:hypothetical protein
MRRDGRLRAETAFTQGHHVTVTLRCQTLWDWYFGMRDDLPLLAHRIRTVSRTRPSLTPQRGRSQGRIAMIMPPLLQTD